MLTTIVGLEYNPSYKKVETEEQLLEVLKELFSTLKDFEKGFKIKDLKGREIENAKSFLENILDEKGILKENRKILLEGSGNIGGLKINGGLVSYDLSKFYNLIGNWDQDRGGTCYGCEDIRKYSWFQDETSLVCDLKTPEEGLPDPPTCEKYKSRVKNKKGKTPRPLAKLIEEVMA